MVDLLDYLKPDRVILLDASGYESILKQAVSLCAGNAKLELNVLQSIKASSRTNAPQDINLGKGFALVHARSDEASDITMSLGLLPKAIHLIKGDLVQALFCIILPNAKSRMYLSLLARLGRLLNQEDAVEVFQEARDRLVAGESNECAKIIIDYISAFESA